MVPKRTTVSKSVKRPGAHHRKTMIVHPRVPARDQDAVPSGKFAADHLDERGDQFGRSGCEANSNDHGNGKPRCDAGPPIVPGGPIVSASPVAHRTKMNRI